MTDDHEAVLHAALKKLGNYEKNFAVADFLRSLPRPESPYEQAIMYRKLVGMES